MRARRSVRWLAARLTAGVGAALLVAVLANRATADPIGTEERAALRAIEVRAAGATKALAYRIASLPRGPERLALERQVIAVKRDAERERLLTMLDYARERADAERVAEVERAIRARSGSDVSAPPPAAPEPKPARSVRRSPR